MLYEWGRMFDSRLSLSDYAWPDGEEWTYLMWSYLEVLIYLTLRKVRTLNLWRKTDD
jgi:hypothetical protein